MLFEGLALNAYKNYPKGFQNYLVRSNTKLNHLSPEIQFYVRY